MRGVWGVVFFLLAEASGAAFAGGTLTFETGPVATGNAGRMALADFNNDGKLDLVIADPGDLVVKVRLGDGAGGFGDPVFSAVLPSAGSGPVAVGDLNGDGIPDFAVGYGVLYDQNSGHVKVYFSNGAGGFTAGPELTVVAWPGSIAIGDLNADGAADIVVGSDTVGQKISVVLGTGHGAFATHTTYFAGNRPSSVVIADFNHDGNLDVVAAAIDSHGVYVYLGNGDGTLTLYDSFVSGAFPMSLAAADLDGDGHLDLVTSIDGDDRIGIIYGDGLGGFSLPQYVTVAKYTNQVFARDLNGDGRPDIVVSTQFNGGEGSNAVYVVRNLGGRAYALQDPAVFTPASGQVAPPQLAAADLNGDRRADLVIGDITLLFGAGDRTQVFLNSTVFPVRRADFDADRRSDILWRNAVSGENYRYPMDGRTILQSEGYLRTVSDLAWSIAGTGDFDGDGKIDILWRNSSSGDNYLYLMDGNAIVGEGYLRTVADPAWQVAGVGDFDGDGKADILWRNSATGENYVYLMNATSIAGEGYLRTVADPAWQVVGVGDFDGDERSDILWRNSSTGENYLYPMQGTAIKPSEGYLRTVPDLNWQVKGIADLDGDGKADIVWRNVSTGENYLYPMNGTSIKPTEGYLRTVADQAWSMVGFGDYDGDGKSDILWRNSSTGENYLYPMDGTTIKPGEGYLRTVPPGQWSVVSK